MGKSPFFMGKLTISMAIFNDAKSPGAAWCHRTAALVDAAGGGRILMGV